VALGKLLTLKAVVDKSHRKVCLFWASMRCCVWLLVLLAAAASRGAVIEGRQPDEVALVGNNAYQSQCQLHIKGHGTTTGIAEAYLSCSGAPLLLALQANFKARIQGTASVSADARCHGNQTECLITFCGGHNILLHQPVVSRVLRDESEVFKALLCVAGNSSVTIYSGDFSTNQVGSAALLLASDSSKVTISNGTVFASNIAAGPMALVVAEDRSKVALEGPETKFAENMVLHGASGIIGVNSSAELSITAGLLQGVAFYNNSARNGSCGALSAGENSKLNISDPVLFQGNKCNGTNLCAGGAICVAGYANAIVMNGVVFVNNTADAGGAIALWGMAKAKVQGNVAFVKNAALGPGPTAKDPGGGAIFISSKAGIELTGNVSLRNNRAVSGGGALDASGTANVTIGDGVRFVHNQAMEHSSGALRMRDNSLLKITPVAVPVEFEMNTAAGASGGALGFRDSSRGTINGPVVFVNNFCNKFAGGAVLVHENAQVSFQRGVVFYNNTAKGGRAGALAVTSADKVNPATVSISEGVLFLSNLAYDRLGGAMAVYGAAHATIAHGVAFVGNIAHRGSGGGIVTEDFARVSLSGRVLFLNNTGDGLKGGAICGMNDSRVYILGSEEPSNSSHGNPTAVKSPLGDLPGVEVNFADSITSRDTDALAPLLSTHFAKVLGAPGLLNVTHVIESTAAMLDSRDVAGQGVVRFASNNAVNDSGGAVAMKGNSTLVVEGNVVFENNTVEGYSAGALSVSENATAQVMSGVRFISNTASKAGGGAMAVIDTGSVEISNNVSFLRNQVLQGGQSIHNAGGAFTLMDNAVLRIKGKGVLFEDNDVQQGQGGAGAASGRSQLLITDGVAFIRNKSPDFHAGALWVTDSVNLSIIGGQGGVEFRDNKAEGSGGALALYEAPGLKVEIGDNVSFIGNAANSAGGGALWVKHVSQLTLHNGVRFTSNTAAYNGGALLVDKSNVTLRGGVAFEWNHANYMGGSIAASDFSSLLILDDSCEFMNNSARSGGYNLHLDADSKYEFAGSSDGALARESVLWLRKDCVVGEQLSQSGICEECPVETFGLDQQPHYSSCKSCPRNAQCSGGHSIVPLSGYWHSSENSTQIHMCPRKASCVSDGKKEMQCAEGYTGNLCAQCVGPEYGSNGFFQCTKCMHAGKTLGLFVTGAFLLLLAVALLVQTTLKDNIVGMSSIRPSALLKIVVRHVQYLIIINSIRFNWPQALGGLFKAAGFAFTVGNPEVVALACVFDPFSSSWGTFSVAVKVLTVYLLAPLGFLVALLAIYTLIGYLSAVTPRRATGLPSPSRRFSAASAVHVLAVSSLVVLFFFYPTYLRTSYSFFACKKLDHVGELSPDLYQEYAVANAAHGYWVPDMQQPCWEGWHKALALAVGVPCLLLFCIGVPGGLAVLLYVNRYNLDFPQGSFQACAGFLYENYRHEQFMWEVVNLLQMVVLVAISVFSHTLGIYYSSLLLLTAFAVVFALLDIFKPYKFRLLNQVALLSFGTLFATAVIAMSMFTVDVATPMAYAEVMGVIGLLINVAFILGALYLVAVHSSGMVKEYMNVVMGWLHTIEQKCIGVAATSAGSNAAAGGALEGISKKGDVADAVSGGAVADAPEGSRDVDATIAMEEGASSHNLPSTQGNTGSKGSKAKMLPGASS
jgi:predicted outer membrane repeat protein